MIASSLLLPPPPQKRVGRRDVRAKHSSLSSDREVPHSHRCHTVSLDHGEEGRHKGTLDLAAPLPGLKSMTGKVPMALLSWLTKPRGYQATPHSLIGHVHTLSVCQAISSCLTDPARVGSGSPSRRSSGFETGSGMEGVYHQSSLISDPERGR